MTKYGVDFDISFYLEVEANSPEEAIEYVKDHLHEATEEEAHNFIALSKPEGKSSPYQPLVGGHVKPQCECCGNLTTKHEIETNLVVSKCCLLDVASQGKDTVEAVNNLKEAVTLLLDDCAFILE